MHTYTQEQKSFTAEWLLRFAKNEFSDHSIEVCHLVNAANMLEAAPSASPLTGWDNGRLIKKQSRDPSEKLDAQEVAFRERLDDAYKEANGYVSTGDTMAHGQGSHAKYWAVWGWQQALKSAPSTSAAPEMSELLGKFEEVLGNKTALHSEYQGKAMPDDVYAAFANLRDVRVPELRAQILAMLAAASTSNELVEMAARLADSELRANQLEAQFKSQCKITAAALEERAKLAAPSTSSDADMFWDSDNSEKQKSSIGEILDDEASNGCLAVGAEFQIQRAVRLPDVWVKVTGIPDHDEVEYEIIKGGAT